MIFNGFALVTDDWLRFLSRTGGKKKPISGVHTLLLKRLWKARFLDSLRLFYLLLKGD